MSKTANAKRKSTKTSKQEQPVMTFPGLNIAELVEKAIREQVKQQVAERIDKLIMAVIHNSTSTGIWCPHRDDNMIRLTNEAREHIRAEVRRSFNEEILHQVAEMSESLKGTIRQRVDENMKLFEVGQGNWVFRTMGDQIKAHVAIMLAKIVNGLELRSKSAQEYGSDKED